ncbi:SatD family protein [Salegentibacter sp. JZCK2]|uniref:SatD family protein n=1 Tax=Salegentibacter tibetensis TaxID=2873600 RepID=UPI001CCD79C2|nr:SatD family protein [Salegentibacter tibetensis]MBZ9729642.1 SatD family protein [Salegentibacter tibetensis]
MIAVITADLVDSSNYSEALLDEILKNLNSEFEKLQQEYAEDEVDFKIYRGDSFQGVISRFQDSLQIALRIKSLINKVKLKDQKPASTLADVKIAIGIGTFDYKGDSMAESNGQAFQFSGRTLDEMKNDSRKIRLKTPLDSLNAEFGASLFLLDAVMEKWSQASAEVVYYLLKGMKETEIAEILKISQSAVNQRKKACGWEAISILLKRFENVTAQSF